MMKKPEQFGQEQAQKSPSLKADSRANINARRFFIAQAVLSAALAVQGCAADQFTVGPSDDGGDETTMIDDGGIDSNVDALPDTDANFDGESGDVKDAAPVYGLSNDPNKNGCVKWMTAKLGVVQDASPDDNNCDPKPYGVLPLNKSYDLYIWDKDGKSNEVAFTTSLGTTTLSTKCSSFNIPPKNSEMLAEMYAAGYSSTPNKSTPPAVDLSNGGCPDAGAAAYVIHIAP